MQKMLVFDPKDMFWNRFLMQRFFDCAAQVSAICLITSLFAYEVCAELRIDITKGVVEPIPIAQRYDWPRQADPFGTNLSHLIAEDLNALVCSSLSSKAFIQNSRDIRTLPRFGDWRNQCSALIQVRAHIVTDGRLRVEFRLRDVFG